MPLSVFPLYFTLVKSYLRIIFKKPYVIFVRLVKLLSHSTWYFFGSSQKP